MLAECRSERHTNALGGGTAAGSIYQPLIRGGVNFDTQLEAIRADIGASSISGSLAHYHSNMNRFRDLSNGVIRLRPQPDLFDSKVLFPAFIFPFHVRVSALSHLHTQHPSSCP
jgi:hypothetical protein